MIFLIGPGASGKTTCGKLLAQRLGVPFYDLDDFYMQNTGDINQHVHSLGYITYARNNFENFLYLRSGVESESIIALSSGFMCYPPDIHPLYAEIRASIAQGPDTICLLASLSRQQCIDLTVARQLARPFMQTTVERQTKVINERFDIYRLIGAIQIGTDSSPEKAIEEMLEYLRSLGSR